MATLATATEKKPQMTAEEKPERKPPQRGRVDDKFKIFSGTANERLADDVCEFLGLTRNQALVTRFKDGEAYVQIQENVRGADVFVIQPTSRPVDEHLMELLLMIDALKRASARRITAVVPYYGYSRQDRKDKPRAPISAKLVADLLTTAGADRATARASRGVVPSAARDAAVGTIGAAHIAISAIVRIGVGADAVGDRIGSMGMRQTLIPQGRATNETKNQ